MAMAAALQSGAVDECGVCSGIGSSCAIVMQLSLRVPPPLLFGSNVEVGLALFAVPLPCQCIAPGCSGRLPLPP